MRTAWCVLALALLGCSDDTKAPIDKGLAKADTVSDGTSVTKDTGKSGDTGTAQDGAAAGIGPAGGQAKSADGFFTLDVPAGALTTTVSFVIKKSSNPPAATVASWPEIKGATVDIPKKTVSVKTTHTSCNCLVAEAAGQLSVKVCYQVKPHNTNFLYDITIAFSSVDTIADFGFRVFSFPGDCPLFA